VIFRSDDETNFSSLGHQAACRFLFFLMTTEQYRNDYEERIKPFLLNSSYAFLIHRRGAEIPEYIGIIFLSATLRSLCGLRLDLRNISTKDPLT